LFIVQLVPTHNRRLFGDVMTTQSALEAPLVITGSVRP
jgi:hypothetical protein